MSTLFNGLRLFTSFALLLLFLYAGYHHQTVIYLIYQGKGQLNVLLNTESVSSFKQQNKLSATELANLELISKIRQFSVDSLAYKPTQNYENVYNQQKSGLLWVITACEPYAFKPYEWTFPLVGRVSYKGYFKKELALTEYNHLSQLGYDVDLRPVTAWSTLGWFNDPILSGMLGRSKGSLCNLIFHELFHATYYASNAVDLNENLASFIGHQATLVFLKNDTAALNEYVTSYNDNRRYNSFMLRQTTYLDNYYKIIQNKANRQHLKYKALVSITDSLALLGIHHKKKYLSIKQNILKTGNACFIDFKQYDSMQDSLEQVFNKIYKGNLKKLVQDLKQNEINY